MTLDFIFKLCTGHDTAYWSERGDLDWFNTYADGSDAGKGILIANWNQFPRPKDQEFNWSRKGRKFQSILESIGYQLEWRDQTDRCEDCDGCIQTEHQYHGDTAHYAIIGDCSIVCEDCIRKNCTEEYLTGLEDNPRTAVSIRGIDPTKYGYVQIAKDFENGFHPGQTDDPRVILKDLESKGYSGVIFKIDGSGQFDIEFSAYARMKDGEALVQETEETI